MSILGATRNMLKASPVAQEPAFNAGDSGLTPGSGRSPLRRKWQLTPVFLPGKFHEQRSWRATVCGGHKRVGHDLMTKQQQEICLYLNFSTLISL